MPVWRQHAGLGAVSFPVQSRAQLASLALQLVQARVRWVRLSRKPRNARGGAFNAAALPVDLPAAGDI